MAKLSVAFVALATLCASIVAAPSSPASDSGTMVIPLERRRGLEVTTADGVYNTTAARIATEIAKGLVAIHFEHP